MARKSYTVQEIIIREIASITSAAHAARERRDALASQALESEALRTSDASEHQPHEEAQTAPTWGWAEEVQKILRNGTYTELIYRTFPAELGMYMILALARALVQVADVPRNERDEIRHAVRRSHQMLVAAKKDDRCKQRHSMLLEKALARWARKPCPFPDVIVREITSVAKAAVAAQKRYNKKREHDRSRTSDAGEHQPHEEAQTAPTETTADEAQEPPKKRPTFMEIAYSVAPREFGLYTILALVRVLVEVGDPPREERTEILRTIRRAYEKLAANEDHVYNEFENIRLLDKELEPWARKIRARRRA